jgi:hypothetical protein
MIVAGKNQSRVDWGSLARQRCRLHKRVFPGKQRDFGGSKWKRNTTRQSLCVGARFIPDSPTGGHLMVRHRFSSALVFGLTGLLLLSASLPARAWHVITIRDRAAVELGDFVLQKRYPTVAVKGVVVTPDGKPIADAHVNLNKNGGEWDTARPVKTDTSGHFAHQAFEGVAYYLQATADSPAGGILESDRIEVKAGKDSVPVRLVLKPPK